MGYTTSNAPAGKGYRCIWVDGRNSCDSYLPGKQNERLCEKLVIPSGNPLDDVSRYCESWSKNNECDKNPGYMLQNCATSCAIVGATDYATV